MKPARTLLALTTLALAALAPAATASAATPGELSLIYDQTVSTGSYATNATYNPGASMTHIVVLVEVSGGCAAANTELLAPQFARISPPGTLPDLGNPWKTAFTSSGAPSGPFLVGGDFVCRSRSEFDGAGANSYLIPLGGTIPSGTRRIRVWAGGTPGPIGNVTVGNFPATQAVTCSDCAGASTGPTEVSGTVALADGDASRLDLVWIGLWLTLGMAAALVVGRLFNGEVRKWSGAWR